MHLCCFVVRLVGVRGSGPQVSSLFPLCRFSCIAAGYAIDDICCDAGEMVSDFNGSIGS